MKKALYITTIFSALFFQKAHAQASIDSLFKNQLMQLAHKRIEAFDLGDTSIWSPYVANEYIISTPTGKIATKSDVMKEFGPPLKGYRNTFDFEDVSVIKDSNVAVMSYKIKEREWWEKQENNVLDLRKTDTYIYKNGQWLLFASHENFYPPLRQTTTVNTKIYDSYLGQYQLLDSLFYTISKENNKLFIQENNNPQKVELFASAKNSFFNKANEGFFNLGGMGQVLFIKNNRGKVSYLVFRTYGIDIKAKKIK